MKKWFALALIFLLALAAMAMAVYIRFPVRYLDIIQANAGDLEPSLILAVIMAESSFRQRAESHRGAQGLMQLMPSTAREIAEQMGISSYDIWLPETNIAMGSFYLNRLKALYGGNLDLALAAYNAGRGNVNSWLANPEFSSDGQTLDTIPFPETRNYLRRVRQNQRIYNIILAITRRGGNGGGV